MFVSGFVILVLSSPCPNFSLYLARGVWVRGSSTCTVSDDGGAAVVPLVSPRWCSVHCKYFLFKKLLKQKRIAFSMSSKWKLISSLYLWLFLVFSVVLIYTNISYSKTCFCGQTSCSWTIQTSFDLLLFSIFPSNSQQSFGSFVARLNVYSIESGTYWGSRAGSHTWGQAVRPQREEEERSIIISNRLT